MSELNWGFIPEVSDGCLFLPPELPKTVFTTKPTGEGTGPELSLSYDIITKGHGGILSLDPTVAEGTTFVIQLPSPVPQPV